MTRNRVTTIMASILVGAGLAAACTAPDIEPPPPPIGFVDIYAARTSTDLGDHPVTTGALSQIDILTHGRNLR